MDSSTRLDARAMVVKALAARGALSRAELTRATALAFSTVSAAVSDLQAAGLVREVSSPAKESTLGRPAVRLTLTRAGGVAIGVEVGKQHLSVVLADVSHLVLAEVKHPMEPDLPAQTTARIVADAVEEALDLGGAHRDEVLGIGLALPAPITADLLEVGNASILPGWIGVAPQALLEKTIGLPVLVGNDANLGALGEWMWGAGRGVDHMLFLKAATGIGAGLILGGRPHEGVGGTAGEIGHSPVDVNGPICRCGNRGCLELMAGSPAVLTALRTTHGSDVTLDDAIASAVAGDMGAIRAIGDAGRLIGEAAAVLCNLVNPSLIVVGGELSAAGEVLLEPLRSSLARSALPSASADVRVVTSELGERVVAWGALGRVLTSIPSRGSKGTSSTIASSAVTDAGP